MSAARVRTYPADQPGKYPSAGAETLNGPELRAAGGSDVIMSNAGKNPPTRDGLMTRFYDAVKTTTAYSIRRLFVRGAPIVALKIRDHEYRDRGRVVAGLWQSLSAPGPTARETAPGARHAGAGRYVFFRWFTTDKEVETAIRRGKEHFEC
jgi:hypothetical protein